MTIQRTEAWQTPMLQQFGTFAALTQQVVLTPQECIDAIAAGDKTSGGDDGCEVLVNQLSIPVGSP